MLHAEINAQCLQHLSGDTYLLCPDPAWLFSPQGGFPEQSVSSFREARGCGGRMQCQLQQHQQQRLEEGLTAHLLFCRTSVLLSYPAMNFSHCYILNQSWSLCVTVSAGLTPYRIAVLQEEASTVGPVAPWDQGDLSASFTPYPQYWELPPAFLQKHKNIYSLPAQQV